VVQEAVPVELSMLWLLRPYLRRTLTLSVRAGQLVLQDRRVALVVPVAQALSSSKSISFKEKLWLLHKV
jgi:hypothetical protein